MKTILKEDNEKYIKRKEKIKEYCKKNIEIDSSVVVIINIIILSIIIFMNFHAVREFISYIFNLLNFEILIMTILGTFFLSIFLVSLYRTLKFNKISQSKGV